MEAATPKASDSALVIAARAGDAGARTALYHRFATDIYTLLRRVLGSDSLAEDVLQETFIDVFTRLAELRDESAIGAWLRRIAVNRAFSQLRSTWISRRVEWTDEDFLALPSAAETDSDTARLEAALDALPHAARAVVWLYDVEGYTHKEIAALMGRSVSFSKSRLARAHAQLREILGEEPERDEADERTSAKGRKLCIGELKAI